MSRKSRRVEEPGGRSARKARTGKRSAAAGGGSRQPVGAAPSRGVPFPAVVLLAAVMTLPSLVHYLSGGLEFDAFMIRALAGLAVAYALFGLVYVVLETVRPDATGAVAELPPRQSYATMAAEGPLSGTIVGNPHAAAPDPVALDPVVPRPAADADAAAPEPQG